MDRLALIAGPGYPEDNLQERALEPLSRPAPQNKESDQGSAGSGGHSIMTSLKFDPTFLVLLVMRLGLK